MPVFLYRALARSEDNRPGAVDDWAAGLAAARSLLHRAQADADFMRIAVEMIELFSVEKLRREQELVRETCDHALKRLAVAEPTERLQVELSKIVIPTLKNLVPKLEASGLESGSAGRLLPLAEEIIVTKGRVEPIKK
jgi:hypothetical protein